MEHSLYDVDKEARFQKVYDAYMQDVYRLCFSYMKNKMDTEDAVQETFCRFYQAMERVKEEEHVNADMDIKSMFILAVATSIDALAVGVTFAFLKVEIVSAVSFIGGITFVCSAAGVKIGSLFGMKYKSKAELCGGIILILIGTKILLEGLGMI